ncbi:MAG: hypothetical protein AAF483_13720 [Planctomycetota bacterium]
MQFNNQNKSNELLSDQDVDSVSQFSTQDRIELFAEGELSGEQRSALLSELDAEPSKWKQLAVALIEQVTLQSAVADACKQSDKLQLTGPASSQTGESWGARILPSLSIAAAILVSFGMGYFTSQRKPSSELVDVITPGDDVFQNEAPEKVPEVDRPGTSSKPLLAVEDGKANQIVGYATWVGNYGLQSSPVFLGKSFENNWSKENPPRLNPSMEKRFAKAGVEARPERRFVSLELKDGPLLTVPIDDWKLSRISRETF